MDHASHVDDVGGLPILYFLNAACSQAILATTTSMVGTYSGLKVRICYIFYKI
jgi:hypothetical protein